MRTHSRILAMIATAGLMLSGCGEKKDDENTEETAGGNPSSGGGGGGGTSATGTITMSGTLALAGTALVQSSLNDLLLYCVTFESTPAAATSEFGGAGEFSVQVKANTPFGCFVNEKATNKTRATFVLETGISGGLGGSGTNSLALNGDVDLGALMIGEGGEVRIPAAAVSDKKATLAAAIDLDQVHNSGYTMECIDTGDAARQAACIDMLADGGSTPMTVFFRILKGKKGDEDIFGLGVWQNKTSFDNCGGFDMTADDLSGIASEGYVLSQVSTGAFAGENCQKREEDEDFSAGNIENYYAMSRLIPTPAGYSFQDSSEGQHGECKYSHSTAIEFAGTTDEMIGAFTSKDFRSGNCGDEGEKEEVAMFNVKFVKQ